MRGLRRRSLTRAAPSPPLRLRLRFPPGRKVHEGLFPHAGEGGRRRLSRDRSGASSITTPHRSFLDPAKVGWSNRPANRGPSMTVLRALLFAGGLIGAGSVYLGWALTSESGYEAGGRALKAQVGFLTMPQAERQSLRKLALMKAAGRLRVGHRRGVLGPDLPALCRRGAGTARRRLRHPAGRAGALLPGRFRPEPLPRRLARFGAEGADIRGNSSECEGRAPARRGHGAQRQRRGPRSGRALSVTSLRHT